MQTEYKIETEFKCFIDYRTLLLDFKKIIKNNNLKFTRQREQILRELYSLRTHVTPEELYQKIHISNPKSKTGIATVYRTLLLLEKEAFVTAIVTEKDAKRYELASKAHHDHIICKTCGIIVEFSNDEVEKIQEITANSLGFKVVGHSMQIFGICKNCQEKDNL